MSFGFGDSWENTDVFLCQNGEVTDRYSFGWSTPGKDYSQDYSLISFSSNATHQSYKVQRSIDTGDDMDYLITKVRNNVCNLV